MSTDRRAVVLAPATILADIVTTVLVYVYFVEDGIHRSAGLTVGVVITMLIDMCLEAALYYVTWGSKTANKTRAAIAVSFIAGSIVLILTLVNTEGIFALSFIVVFIEVFQIVVDTYAAVCAWSDDNPDEGFGCTKVFGDGNKCTALISVVAIILDIIMAFFVFFFESNYDDGRHDTECGGEYWACPPPAPPAPPPIGLSPASPSIYSDAAYTYDNWANSDGPDTGLTKWTYKLFADRYQLFFQDDGYAGDNYLKPGSMTEKGGAFNALFWVFFILQAFVTVGLNSVWLVGFYEKPTKCGFFGLSVVQLGISIFCGVGIYVNNKLAMPLFGLQTFELGLSILTLELLETVKDTYIGIKAIRKGKGDGESSYGSSNQE